MKFYNLGDKTFDVNYILTLGTQYFTLRRSLQTYDKDNHCKPETGRVQQSTETPCPELTTESLIVNLIVMRYCHSIIVIEH